MRALIKTDKEREVIISEVLPPKLSSGEVLIEVDYCGICGSDLHAFKHAKNYEFVKKDRILGHELVGKVIDVFDSQDQNLINKTVIVESIQYCGNCNTCKEGKTHICNNFQVFGLHFDGGMAEYAKCSAQFVQIVPQGLSKEIAVLVEPMAIAVHAVEQISQVKPGETVLVQGPGIIGLFVSLVCISKGVNVIISGLSTDYQTRLRHAEKYGILTHIAGDSLPLVDGGMIDTIFECSGSDKAFTSGLDNLKKGGEYVVIALFEENVSVSLSDVVRNEWAIKGSYGANPIDYKKSFKILKIFEDTFKHIVAYYPLSMAEKAFRDALDQRVLKPVFKIKNGQ